MSSSSGSGLVISGSQGITQVPQAVLHQVAVDTGLVQVPQPGTPPQAPPISVRQVISRVTFLPVLAAVQDALDLVSAAVGVDSSSLHGL